VTIATREVSRQDPEQHQLVSRWGRTVPEVEERIMALLPGRRVDATVHFPSDFPDEAKRGQAATFASPARDQASSCPSWMTRSAREVGTSSRSSAPQGLGRTVS